MDGGPDCHASGLRLEEISKGYCWGKDAGYFSFRNGRYVISGICAGTGTGHKFPHKLGKMPYFSLDFIPIKKMCR